MSKMSLFDSAEHYDSLLLKIAGEQGFQKVPLCEILDGDLDQAKTNDHEIVLLQLAKGKKVTASYTNKEFLELLRDKLKMKVADFAILPEGQVNTPAVTAFVDKY